MEPWTARLCGQRQLYESDTSDHAARCSSEHGWSLVVRSVVRDRQAFLGAGRVRHRCPEGHGGRDDAGPHRQVHVLLVVVRPAGVHLQCGSELLSISRLSDSAFTPVPWISARHAAVRSVSSWCG